MSSAIIGAALASAFNSAQECLRQFGGAFMRPRTETPHAGEAWGAGQNTEAGNLSRECHRAASIRNPAWWGSQPCTCRGAVRRNVAAYSLGTPAWPRPGFFENEEVSE